MRTDIKTQPEEDTGEVFARTSLYAMDAHASTSKMKMDVLKKMIAVFLGSFTGFVFVVVVVFSCLLLGQLYSQLDFHIRWGGDRCETSDAISEDYIP